MSDIQTKFYKLDKIANWQLDAENADVGLPALQRGYVWKPDQVEKLWDSLLRGFPIGSFLVSETIEKKGKKDLLDGQQRATAIAMGFYNPWENVKHPTFFSNKFKKINETVPIIWLDIGISEESDKGDYLFLPRLVTQSHPWGFNHYSKPLSIEYRRQANIEFEKNNAKYPHYDLKEVYPWDAELPVPLVFIIEAINESIENWREKLLEKSIKHLLKVIQYDDAETLYFQKLKETLRDNNICNKIEKAVNTILQTQIPIIPLINEHLEQESSSSTEDASTLFVRINTAGTSLNGEELIYSIYKTKFPESKEIVESASAGFIAPSRIITLVSRIVLTDISGKETAFKYSNQLNLKQFKNQIKDINGAFYKGMMHFAKDENYIKLLFQNVQFILCGEKEFQLPVPLAVEIARGNVDVLFILIYWLHATKIKVTEILNSELLHKKILAAITTLNWFALDTNRFLIELAKNKSDNGKIEFWNSNLFRVQGNNRYFIYLPQPKIVRNILQRKINNPGWDKWDEIFDNKEEEKNIFLELFHKLYWQRQMILYAQRFYIIERFMQLQWDTLLEDTNRPYDWDHIYPDSWWAYNTANLNPITKDWRSSNGNFRALAIEDNRSEGAKKSPKKRLEKFLKESFITDKNWTYWQQIDDKIGDNEVETLAQAIANRMVDIYEDWYIQLGVNELFDEKIILED